MLAILLAAYAVGAVLTWGDYKEKKVIKICEVQCADACTRVTGIKVSPSKEIKK